MLINKSKTKTKKFIQVVITIIFMNIKKNKI